MPIAALTSSTPTPPAEPDAGVRPVSADANFDAVLAGRMASPETLPSVSLARMVDALARGSQPLAPVEYATAQATGVAGPLATTAPATGGADAWGTTAAGRPRGPIHAVGARVLEAGEAYLGVPYTWGGTTAAGGFDCSGFVQQVYADLGVRLPRVSADQARAGTAVPDLAQARPGDLVFWHGEGSRPNHIGIFAGDNTMLVAPRTGDVVKYQEIRRPPDDIRRVMG